MKIIFNRLRPFSSLLSGFARFALLLGSLGGTIPALGAQAGIDWTLHPAAVNHSWTSVTYGNGRFVAVALVGSDSVMTSPDGSTWTSRTSAAANQWYGVTYGNGLFVAVAASGSSDRVMTSSTTFSVSATVSLTENA
jgi:hypothetical protein